MYECPIRKITKEKFPKLYECVIKKESKVRNDCKTESEEGMNKLITKLERQWAGIFNQLIHDKAIVKSKPFKNDSLVWSNLFGTTYNPEKFHSKLAKIDSDDKLTKTKLYFLFWGISNETEERNQQ